jgi:hypothetical protein
MAKKKMPLITETATFLVIEMGLSVFERPISLYLSWRHYIHLQSMFRAV